MDVIYKLQDSGSRINNKQDYKKPRKPENIKINRVLDLEYRKTSEFPRKQKISRVSRQVSIVNKKKASVENRKRK